MGKALRRVLLADTKEELRRHVRELAVQHTKEGCFEVDDGYGMGDREYGQAYDVCHILFRETIHLLPKLEVLDLSRFPLLDREEKTWLGALNAICTSGGPDWSRSTGFATVRRMALHLGTVRCGKMWVVFRLPNLKELEIDVRCPARSISWDRADEAWWSVGTSHVEALRVLGLDNRCGRPHMLHLMSCACAALRSVFVSMTDMNTTHQVPQIFDGHVRCGNLKILQMAVVGLWHYEVELGSIGEGCNSSRLGIELQDVMIHATGCYDGNKEGVLESEHVKVVNIREQSENEKKAYDPRLARRP